MKDEEIIKKVLDDKLGVVVSEDVKKIMKEAIRLTREDCEKEIEERINKDVYWNALFDREYKRGQKAEREKFEKAIDESGGYLNTDDMATKYRKQGADMVKQELKQKLGLGKEVGK